MTASQPAQSAWWTRRGVGGVLIDPRHLINMGAFPNICISCSINDHDLNTKQSSLHETLYTRVLVRSSVRSSVCLLEQVKSTVTLCVRSSIHTYIHTYIHRISHHSQFNHSRYVYSFVRTCVTYLIITGSTTVASHCRIIHHIGVNASLPSTSVSSMSSDVDSNIDSPPTAAVVSNSRRGKRGRPSSKW